LLLFVCLFCFFLFVHLSLLISFIFCCCLLLLVLLLWVFYFYFYSYFFSLSILSTLPSLSSHLYSYSLHSSSFSCAKTHCPPLQRLILPPHPLSSPSLHLPLPFSPNLSPDYASLLHTHHPLNNLLYQLYTTPNP
jgi:hypothetical protein